MARTVSTPYGELPGCPDWVIYLGPGPHLCEHGVGTVEDVELTLHAVFELGPEDLMRLWGWR